MPKLPHQESFTTQLYKLEKNKNYLIIKGNPIVQDSHYSMPLAHQKILASLIRSIKPGQHSLKVKFSTTQYMRMLGLTKGGSNFDRVKHDLKKVADDSFWIKRKDGSEDLLRWITHVHADPKGHGKGDFIVQFEKELRPYLFSQSIKYHTIYKFSDIMLMQSRYSPRLFEIFRSNQSRQKVQKRGLNYSISELKYALNLMHRNKNTGHVMHDKNGNIKFMYPQFHDFDRRVLAPAEREINQLTEYNVKLTQVHHKGHGKKIFGINVVMTRKNSQEQRKRDDRIYCITHHIPKKDWGHWREDTIRGSFHKVNKYHKKHGKVINGEYKVVHQHKGQNKVKLLVPGTHQYIWVNSKVVKKKLPDQTKINHKNPTDQDLLNKFAYKVNDNGEYLIYDPSIQTKIWCRKTEAVKIAKENKRENDEMDLIKKHDLGKY